MADANVILGSTYKPIDPLSVLSGWQQYANQVQQGANMKQELANLQLTNQTGQQALATTMQKRHNQIMAGLLGLPNEQLVGAAQTALNQELQTGQVDQQRYDVMNQALKDNASNPQAIRQMIASGLVSNLEPVQALQASVPGIDQTNIGGAIVGRQTPSPASLLAGGAPSITNIPGSAIPTILPPGYQNTGGQLVPVGGALGQPPLTTTLSPSEQTALQSRLVPDGNGGFNVETRTVGQWNPQLMPGGAPNLGPGSYPAPAGQGQPGQPTGAQPSGGGQPRAAAGPPVTSIPQGQPEQQASDLQAYQKDTQAAPGLITGTQSLNKALGALNTVATGQGTEGLARMRSVVTSLANVLGIDTGNVNIQDMSRAELEKYLTDYARSQATAGRSDEALNTAFKANASGYINNAAAQDVVRTNIGRDRMNAFVSSFAPNKTGTGYSAFKRDFVNSVDPRGFAWDTYTPQQKAQIVKEVLAMPGGKNGVAYRKLSNAIGYATQRGIATNQDYSIPNVNAAAMPAQ